MFTTKHITKVITWAIHIAETENTFHEEKLNVCERDGLTWYLSQYMCAAIPTDGFTLQHSKKSVIPVDKFLNQDSLETVCDTRQTVEIFLKKKTVKLRIFKDKDGNEYRVREDFLKLFSGLDGWYLTGSRDREKVFVHDSADPEKSPVGIICCVEKR